MPILGILTLFELMQNTQIQPGFDNFVMTDKFPVSAPNMNAGNENAPCSSAT